LLKSYNKLL